MSYEDALFDPGPAVVHPWTMWGNTRRWTPTSGQDVRGTPRNLFNLLDQEFGFTIDVAALRDNALCERYFTPDTDGLAQDWAPETCWMNPPYSELEAWTGKAVAESRGGATVVALLPVRADLGWFHDNVLEEGAEVRFIRGRVAFNGMNGKAPFASMVVVWRPGQRAELAELPE